MRGLQFQPHKLMEKISFEQNDGDAVLVIMSVTTVALSF